MSASKMLHCFACLLILFLSVSFAQPPLNVINELHTPGEFYALETADLGQTGQTTGLLVVNQNQFIGAKFELTERGNLERMGAHLLGIGIDIPLFMAIVPLDPITDLPLDRNLTSAIAARRFFAPRPSGEVMVDIDFEIDPGRYGLVIGSGLFDTGGSALTTDNDIEIGFPDDFTGINQVPGDTTTFVWQDSDDILENSRLFVIVSDTIFRESFE